MKCGVCRLPVDWWDVGVFKAHNELVDSEGRHGGG